MTDLPDAVFHLDGDRVVPTALARGPWSPDAQHGGGPAALLARAVERCDPGPADFVARLTIDLLRPIPLTPLQVTARTTRPGKKVQWIEASILAGDVEVARANALRIRTDDALALPVLEKEPLGIAGPESGSTFELGFPNQDPGFWRAMELRMVAGSWMEPGPATIWFRIALPIVAGEEPTPLQRVAAAADFGNGVSSSLERGRYVFINPDLSIHLHRLPVGEWVALDAITFAESHGVGLAESALHDEQGRIGRSLQSLLIDRF